MSRHVPTLTEVLPSSSEARLPPPALLVMLMRLFVLGGLIIALIGRWGKPAGDSGGELAMALDAPSLRQNRLWLRVCDRKVGRDRVVDKQWIQYLA